MILRKAGWFLLLGAFAVALQLPNMIWSDPVRQDLGIRVVNVKKVYNSCKLKDRLQSELDAWSREESKKLDELKKEVEGFRHAMQTVERNSPKYLEFREQFMVRSALFNARMEQSEIQMKEMAATNMQKLYSAIRNAIDKYALDHGLLLVLKFDEADISDVSPDVASDQINYRSVLHCEKSLDITEEIIRAMDAEFKKEGE